MLENRKLYKTNSGLTVQIVSTIQKHTDYPILAVVFMGHHDVELVSYTKEGRFIATREDPMDLVMD